MVKLPYNASPENSSRPANRALSSPVRGRLRRREISFCSAGYRNAPILTRRSGMMTQAAPA